MRSNFRQVHTRVYEQRKSCFAMNKKANELMPQKMIRRLGKNAVFEHGRSENMKYDEVENTLPEFNTAELGLTPPSTQHVVTCISSIESRNTMKYRYTGHSCIELSLFMPLKNLTVRLCQVTATKKNWWCYLSLHSLWHQFPSSLILHMQCSDVEQSIEMSLMGNGNT